MLGSEISGPHRGHHRAWVIAVESWCGSWPRFRCVSWRTRPTPTPRRLESLGVRLTTLDEVLAESDFVSLHCRLTPETRGMIGATQLALMKPSAYLINVGRGELVDQPALVAALRDRKIAGAGLDVFDVEPLPADDPLIQLDNVILTPHWLASTTDVWAATGNAMAEGMLRAARGELPENVVNPEVLEVELFQGKLGRFRDNQVEI